ncbi:uncharacterized protein [Antedon mediterranea]|uniref:uncharacterized protein n=1 Tax=Antedon mediterranea TaxID=105859 RepID=UPI003AF7E5D9
MASLERNDEFDDLKAELDASEDPVKAKKPRKSRKKESEDQVKAKKPRKSTKKTTLRDYVREMFAEKKCSVKKDSEKSPKEMELFKGIDDSEPSTSHQQLPSQDTMRDEHAVDEICNSLKRFCTYMRRGKSLKTDRDIIKMISSMNRKEEKWKHSKRWEWIQQKSDDIGRMLAHIIIAVKDEKYVLSKISQSCTDDVVKGLSTECSKYTFRYSIEGFSLVKPHIYISTSFLIHFLVNAPRLKSLNLSGATNANMNDIVSVLSQKCLVLALDNLDISENNLSDITCSSLGTLLAIFPKLKTLDMYKCDLSGVIIDAMVRECVNRNLMLELDNLNISENNLNDITGSSLATLLAITPKLKTLNISSCSMSGVIIDAMVKECVNRNLVLELDNLNIIGNKLNDITGSVLGTLLAISPKLKNLDMNYCSLSGVIIGAMVRECVNRNLVLELDNLYIRGNTLSDITGSVLGTLLAISPKLKNLDMNYCRLSGVVIDAMVRECVNRNLVLELDNLDISGNTLTDITGSSLTTLLAISPKLKKLDMRKCKLPNDVVQDMTQHFQTIDGVFSYK